MRLELALSLFAVTDLVTAVGPCFCCDGKATATSGKALFVTGYENCEDMKGCNPSSCGRQYIFCPKPNIGEIDLPLYVACKFDNGKQPGPA